VGDIPLPLLFGFLSREDIKGQNWAVLGRVSSNSQFNNTSTETQIEEVTEECEKANGTTEHEYELAESGASIHRKSLEEIVTKGENDEIDILGVSKFDRLMRADPWEGMEYLKQLKQADVTLYVGTHGYFDYDDMFDFRILVQQVLFSRKWFERIRENAKNGQISKLEKGKWPFGTPGYGYAKDDDSKIYLENEKESVLAAVFEEYKQEKSKPTVQDNIEERFDIEDLPSESQIGTILDNRLCVGDLVYKNRVIRREPELAVIDRETFEEIREIRQDQRPTSGDAREIPEPVDRAATDFNPKYVIDMIDSLTIQCRKCGSDLRKNGTKERGGRKVQNYKCKD
jgi:DNA invertase Pin-like site-specific DNA recombinase